MPINAKPGTDAVLISALSAGASVAEAADRAGVSGRTVFRRLQDAGFRARLDAAQSAAISRAVAALAAASGRAVATLSELLDEPTPSTVRLGAARSVLELGQRLREGHELEARLTALEAAVKAALEKGEAR